MAEMPKLQYTNTNTKITKFYLKAKLTLKSFLKVATLGD